MAEESDPVVVLHSLFHIQETTAVCKVLPRPPLLVVPQEEAIPLVPQGATFQAEVIRKSNFKTGDFTPLISYLNYHRSNKGAIVGKFFSAPF